MAFLEQVLNLLRSGAAMTAGGSILATGAYVMYKDYNRFARMEQSFSRGNILAPLAENPYEVKYHHRPDVEARLEAALRPVFSNEYYLVSGEVGSGKTRTIVEMVRRMMLEDGVHGLGAPVYVSVAQGKCFPDTLAKAVHFFFDEHISFKFFLDFALRIHSFPGKDEHHKLTRVLDALEQAAFLYMQKTGRPVVLVVDGADNLATNTCNMPQVLERLQVKAKLWADTNIVKIIFVNNDEKTELSLQEHASNWSRAATPICVGDMSKEQAISFLTSSQLLESDNDSVASLSDADALKVYDLVGGRVHHMISFKRDAAAGIPLESTTDELMFKEREKFMDVSKSSTILKLICMIKNAGHKGVPLAKLIDAGSEKHVDVMMKYNIIRIERNGTGMTAMFASRLTENVATRMSVCKQ